MDRRLERLSYVVGASFWAIQDIWKEAQVMLKT